MTGIGDGAGGQGSGLRGGSLFGTGVTRGSILELLGPDVDFDESTIIDDGAGPPSNVISWNDKSAKGQERAAEARNLERVSTQSPQTGVETLNGLPVVVFNGNSSLRAIDRILPPAGAGMANDMLGDPDELEHVFAVVRKSGTSPATAPFIMAQGDATDAPSLTANLYVYILSTGAVRVDQDSRLVDLGDFTSTATPFSDNDWHLFELFLYRGGATGGATHWEVRVDGVEILRAKFQAFGSGRSYTDLEIGHNQNAAGRFQGAIATIYSLSGVVDGGSTDKARDFIVNKYGLTGQTRFVSQATAGGFSDIEGLSGLTAYVDFSDQSAVVRVADSFLDYTDPVSGLGWEIYDDVTEEYPGWLLLNAPSGDALRTNAQLWRMNVPTRVLGTGGGYHFVYRLRWTGEGAAQIRGASGDSDEHDLQIDADGKASFRFSGVSFKQEIFEAGTTMADQDWHVVELIKDDTLREMFLRIDGVEVATGTYTAFSSAYDLTRWIFEGPGIDIAEAALFDFNTGGATAAANMLARRAPSFGTTPATIADDYFALDAASLTFPVTGSNGGEMTEVFAATSLSSITSDTDGGNLTRFQQGYYEVLLDDQPSFDGFAMSGVFSVDDGTFDAANFDQEVFTLWDSNGNIVLQVQGDYLNPDGWYWGLRYFDDANTEHETAVNTADGGRFYGISVDNVDQPFVVGVNAGGNEIRVVTSGGTIQTIPVAGTGKIRCVGGISRFTLGRPTNGANSVFSAGRVGLKTSALPELQMVDLFWNLRGGVPTSFELGQWTRQSGAWLRDHAKFVVPSGFTNASIDVVGAVTGSSFISGIGGSGDPNIMTVSKSVTPGEAIYIGKGGQSRNVVAGGGPVTANVNKWGEVYKVATWLGAVGQSSGSGDRSEIMGGEPPFVNGDQLVIAASPGGSYAEGQGGDGGYPNGQAGQNAAGPGGGGTQVAGGAAGATGGLPGAAYAPGVGNNGPGGDGFFGGGSNSFGSSSPQAGGGGSGYFDNTSDWTLDSSGTKAHAHTYGNNVGGNGEIIIRLT